MEPRDWAEEIIRDMQIEGWVDADDAIRSFCAAYANGDSVEAWKAFEAAAATVYYFQPGDFPLLIFPDGSCYAEWKQGTDRFYPSVDDLAAEDEEVRNRISNS
jgi:hypothetical protein